MFSWFKVKKIRVIYIPVNSFLKTWLDELSKEMKNTLEKMLVQCLQDSKKELGNYSVDKYPSQVRIFYLTLIDG